MTVSPRKVKAQAEGFLASLASPAAAVAETVAEMSASDLAARLDPRWAVPALTRLWSAALLEERLAVVRPAVKRAIALLLASGKPGAERSYASLRHLLAACQEEAASEAAHVSRGWGSTFAENDRSRGPEPLLRVELAGAQMQTARDAQGLVRDGLPRGLTALAAVLNGAQDRSSLAESAPHLALVPAVGPGREIWLGVYLRLALLVSIERFNPGNRSADLAVMPQMFFSQGFFVDGDAALSVVFTSEDIRRLAVPSVGDFNTMGHEAVVAMPLIPAGAYYVTSHAIVLDSIAPYLMASIERSGFWQEAVGDFFEAEVRSLLRAHGFLAGEVTQAGHWRHESEDTQGVALSRTLARHASRSPLSGQIDVLAVRDGDILLLECKSISTMARAVNTVGKLSPEDQGAYRSTLRKKVRWVEDAVGRKVSLAVVVIEGAVFVDTSQGFDDVLVIDRLVLSELLRKEGEARGKANSTVL